MDFHFSLLENGLDFVLSSLEHLTAASNLSSAAESRSEPLAALEGQKRHLKYALLHLCSSMELIFKERLRQEDWRFVFHDLKKANEEAYASGDFQSVHFKEAQERLENECGIELTTKQKTDLKNFRDRRNRIEHFGALDSLLAVQSSVTQMVNFLVDFVEEAFEDEGLHEEEGLLSVIRAKLGSCNAVVSERWTLIQSEVDQQYSTIECPSCRQEAMIADGGTVKCLFCNCSMNPETAASEYVANVLGYTNRDSVVSDGGEWPVSACPDCRSNTFVTAVHGACDVDDGYCFFCGVNYAVKDLERCYDCGELYVWRDQRGFHVCSGCFRARMSKDD